MRIGLFGGSFDPPHLAHLALAEAARTSFGLSRVLLAPAAIQPLKPGGAQATFAQRLRMVELLCEGQPGLDASPIDGPQPGAAPNYTIDTLHRLRSSLPADDEIFVVVGADAFLDLPRWKDPNDLLREACWIVVNRPGIDLSSLDAMNLTPAQRARVHMLGNLSIPISATDIRDRLQHRSEAAAFVPPKVLDYIYAHHLYGT